ncbi:MAG: SRPBCC family protein [Chloroflexi bacterium]|nr:SRPBCC family protein [Chloroflexota bacterium]
MIFRTSIVIPKPIEEVFAFAADQVGASRWQYQVGVKHLAGEENAPGSTYERTSVSAGQPRVHTYELTEVAPPFRFDVRSIEGSSPFHYDYTFVVEDEGTQVFVDVDSADEPPAEVEGRLTFLRRQIAGETPELATAYSTVPQPTDQALAHETTRAAETVAKRQTRPPTPGNHHAAFWLSLFALPLFNIWLLTNVDWEALLPGMPIFNFIGIPAAAIALFIASRQSNNRALARAAQDCWLVRASPLRWPFSRSPP